MLAGAEARIILQFDQFQTTYLVFYEFVTLNLYLSKKQPKSLERAVAEVVQ